MKNCKNCGKPLLIDAKLDFCSKNCVDAFKQEPKGAKPLEANEKVEIKVLKDSTIPYDLNIELIQKAIETQTTIMLQPRRSHIIRNIPLRYDLNTLRVYVDTGRDIESVLLSEIGHFSFPKTLLQINK
jgi:hypothetical protein